MVYETSYESGRKPYRPDLQRGHWASNQDYIFTCIALGFKMDMLAISSWFFFDMGIGAFIPYLINAALFMVPLMVIQSFMGQFSSSGFISAFRMSPVFKGMGYVSLALNSAIPLYYSLFAAVPLLFLVNSLRPTLPWSCEAFGEWSKKLNETEQLSICNGSSWKREDLDEPDIYNSSLQFHIPSVLYFREHFENINFDSYDVSPFTLSWTILCVTIAVWTTIALIFYFNSNTEKMGKFLRKAIYVTLALLIICFARFMFLPGALNGFVNYMTVKPVDIAQGIAAIPLFVLQAFGGGWGSVIVLSSFNKFKTNIMNCSWVICLGQMLVFFSFGLISSMLQFHFETYPGSNYLIYIESQWAMYISSASAISTLHWPNLWSILYYSMLLLAALIVIITFIFTSLTSLFDEFEILRDHKPFVTFSLIGVLGFSSLYFSSNHGILYFTAITVDTMVTQTILHLLLLLAVLWVYGRERFQRDIEFMINQPFQTWKINILRFVSPICLVLTLFGLMFIAFHEHIISAPFVQFMAIFVIYLPLIFIPAYAIFIMIDTAGTICVRFKRAGRPTDWYPLDQEYRQQYEEAMGNMDITHQLTEVSDETI